MGAEQGARSGHAAAAGPAIGLLPECGQLNITDLPSPYII